MLCEKNVPFFVLMFCSIGTHYFLNEHNFQIQNIAIFNGHWKPRQQRNSFLLALVGAGRDYPKGCLKANASASI